MTIAAERLAALQTAKAAHTKALAALERAEARAERTYAALVAALNDTAPKL